jgi:hypothetical protein
MEELKSDIVRELQTMARNGQTVPQMMRAIIVALAPKHPHKVALIQYLREAFCLTLQQAAPIAGWSADGTGELQDTQLNAFLLPEIMKNRDKWDEMVRT